MSSIIAGFLAQLTLSAFVRVFCLSMVKLACGNLPQQRSQRIAALLNQHHASILKHRHNRHGTGMADIFTRRIIAVRQRHMVALYLEQTATKNLFVTAFNINLI